MEDNFSRALDDMSTRVKLPAEEIFEKGLPQVDPPEGRQAQLVERAKNVFGSDDIFVDTSTSLKRLYAKVGGAPRITPEHPIYSTKLKRFLTPAEFLSAQGLFKSCFKDSVWQQMVTVPKFGQDLAGNSFSSTVCQGAVLSSMAACPELWLKASGNLPGEKAKDHKRKLAPTEDHLEPPLQKARTGNSRQEGADPSQFLKRITKKRPAPEYDHFVQDHPRRKKDPKGRAKRKYKRKTDGVDGRKFSKGKKDTLSIWSKMQMLQFYDQEKEKGNRNAAKATSQKFPKGFYRCCLYKWKRDRAAQSWDLLITAAPTLTKKFKEIPNRLRQMMGHPLKFVTRSDGSQEATTTILPPELQEITAETVAERIALGEECDFHFVADVLEAGIDQWNSAVQRLKTRLSKPETLCQELQKQLVEMEGTGSTEPISQEGLNTMVEDLSTSLAPKLRKAAQRLCGKSGLGPEANSKPGKHLPASHPLLAKIREFVRAERDSLKVHERLVCNFDQVWSVQYMPQRATLQAKDGRQDPLRKAPHRGGIRSSSHGKLAARKNPWCRFCSPCQWGRCSLCTGRTVARASNSDYVELAGRPCFPSLCNHAW
ncbi:unnamed protein product [Durusdinium trenchii]|uniref:Uncharacterized protein n=1 Tax=Durusdinium trenchii TaxID=1381693 RepID=A0ABP0HRY4_9DINO